jgi:hypothetical protein
MINQWFEEHPDAILVTDKINEPQKIADPLIGFHFKERCLMELFSWEAVAMAHQVGIIPMASENLLFNILNKNTNRLSRFLYRIGLLDKNKKILNFLDEEQVKYLCFSHYLIAENKDLLQKLKNNNFISYVYLLNYDAVVDEKYVYKNYQNYVSGMYADNLELLDTLK